MSRYVAPEPELVEDGSLTEAEVAVVIGKDFDGITGGDQQALGDGRRVRLIAARRSVPAAGGNGDLGPAAPLTPPCTTE